MSALRSEKLRRVYYPVHATILDGQIRQVKFCRGCGQHKICEPDESAFARHGVYARTGRVVWGPICKECRNRAEKDRRATDPAYVTRVRQRDAAAKKRWLKDPANREKARLSSLRYQRRLKREEPERVLEYARMGYVLRSERKGKSVHHRQTVIDGTQPRVPAEPFHRWMEAYRQQVNSPSLAALARSLCLTDRRVRSVLDGEYARVALDVVDRALTSATVTVWLDGYPIVTVDSLYPATILSGHGETKPREHHGGRAKRWTRDVLLATIREWAAEYGQPPAMPDWDPGQARRNGQEERVQRYRQANGRWPHAQTVAHEFGSWNAAIEAAGFRPRSVGRPPRRLAAGGA